MNTLLRDSWVPALRTHVKGVVQLTLLNSLALKSTTGCRYGLPQYSKSDTTLIYAFAWPVTTHGSLHLVRRARQRISFDLWILIYVLCYVHTYAHIIIIFTTPGARAHAPVMKDYHALYAHIILPRPSWKITTPRTCIPRWSIRVPATGKYLWVTFHADVIL